MIFFFFLIKRKQKAQSAKMRNANRKDGLGLCFTAWTEMVHEWFKASWVSMCSLYFGKWQQKWMDNRKIQSTLFPKKSHPRHDPTTIVHSASLLCSFPPPFLSFFLNLRLLLPCLLYSQLCLRRLFLLFLDSPPLRFWRFSIPFPFTLQSDPN